MKHVLFSKPGYFSHSTGSGYVLGDLAHFGNAEADGIVRHGYGRVIDKKDLAEASSEGVVNRKVMPSAARLPETITK